MLLAKWVLWPVATKNIAKNHCELAEFPCQAVPQTMLPASSRCSRERALSMMRPSRPATAAIMPDTAVRKKLGPSPVVYRG